MAALLAVAEIGMQKHFSDGSSEWLLGSHDRRERFELPRPGVYSLEGPNRSGKTALISLIMGALQRDLVSGAESVSLSVDGARFEIATVRDAFRAGMSAVFQRDELIPTMTIEEQLLLRHVNESWGDARSVALEFALHAIPPIWWFHRYLLSRGREGKHTASLREEVLEPARKTLRHYPRDYQRILGSYPRDLSHGEKAVARLLFAQTVGRCRVLFLDEAFAGVQRNVWPEIQDSLLRWQDENDAAIVVVSHSHEEIIRWNPAQRFRIVDSRLEAFGPTGHEILVTGIPSRPDSYPVFSIASYDQIDWPTITSSSSIEKSVLVVDKAVESHQATGELKNALERLTPGGLLEVKTDGGELNKTVGEGMRVAEQVLGHLRPRTGMVVVVGGGVTLNLGSLVAGLVYRGGFPLLLLPTTIMAVADVAVGSKGSINWVDTARGQIWKHGFGTYVNPTAVLLDQRFIDTLPQSETILGLSEVLKHGLLQDEGLFNDALDLIEKASPDNSRALELARRALALKARALVGDPFERAEAKVLLYGHIHAHSLERASKLVVPHGSCVYFGILVELTLADAEDLYQRVLGAVRKHCPIVCGHWAEISQEAWRDGYDRDAYGSGSEVSIVLVERAGEYGLGGIRVPRTESIPWTKVWGGISRVLSDVA